MVAFVYVVCFFLLGFYNFNTIPKKEFLIKEYILIISTSEIITTRFSPTVPLVHYKLFGLVFLPETLFQCPIIQYSFFYACTRTTHTPKLVFERGIPISEALVQMFSDPFIDARASSCLSLWFIDARGSNTALHNYIYAKSAHLDPLNFINFYSVFFFQSNKKKTSIKVIFFNISYIENTPIY